MTPGIIFTIGHSNHSIERLIELLRAHAVTAIADVRSSPYSRTNPDYNLEFLQQKLKENGIAYVFLGRELGARSQDPACYEQGRVQYQRLAQSSLFQDGLSRVIDGARTYRLALLCAEKEPLACHRTLLVARQLVSLGVSVAHIHADGALESHDQAMHRLLKLLGRSDQDLYRTSEELIADACSFQEKRIAYSDDSHEEASS
jgi:uncharacterized protein (DUF488 family)